MERSILGCELVEDRAYGKRPNLIMSILAIRRNVPSDTRLTEMQAHCEAVVEHVIQPEFFERTSALRKQLIEMPPEQISAFRNFAEEPTAVDELRYEAVGPNGDGRGLTLWRTSTRDQLRRPRETALP